MYTDFYHFQKMPFSPKADAEFCYLSENHETGLAVLANGLDNGVAINVVLGKSGIGKTTLIQYLLKHFQQDCAVCSVSRSVRSGRELLKLILIGFGQSVGEAGKKQLCCRLGDFLESQSKQQSQPSLLIIDDAHTLPADALKVISEVSALCAQQRQQLQLVLVGQHDLLTALNGSQLEAFAKRIGTLCYLEPLTLEDTRAYIHYRLKAAGGERETLFDEPACSAIHEYSDGNPELINALCDDALVYGSALKKKEIDAELVHKAARGNVQWKSEIPSTGAGNVAPRDSRVPWFGRLDRFVKSALVTAGILIGIALTISLISDSPSLDRNQPSTWLSMGVLSGSGEREDPRSSGADVSDAERAALTDEKAIVRTSLQTFNEKKPPQKAQGIISEGNATKNSKQRFSMESRVGSTGINASRLATKGAESISDSLHRQQLEELFARAEQKVASANLVFPKNDNAFAIYTRILEISPNNPRAVSGLDTIAGKYLGWAQARRAEGNLQRSRFFISRGLKVRPGHRELVSLNNQVVLELRDRESRAMAVDALAKQAGQQVASLRLTLPEGRNAYETYQEIFAIDKNNRQAAEGVREIPLQLESLLERALKKKDYGVALAFAEQAVNIGLGGRLDQGDQTHVVAAALRAKKVIRSRIETLLTQAERHFDAKRLVLPPDENAFYSLQRVLKIDPQNQAARTGLSNIEKHYRTFARWELREGNREQALVLVEEGLKGFPDNPDLLALRDQINRQPDNMVSPTMANELREFESEEADAKKRARYFVTF